MTTYSQEQFRQAREREEARLARSQLAWDAWCDRQVANALPRRKSISRDDFLAAIESGHDRPRPAEATAGQQMSPRLASALERRGQMLEATASFTYEEDGVRKHVKAGRTRVIPTHWLVRRFPGRWRVAEGVATGARVLLR